jgi:hypothetical protein
MGSRLQLDLRYVRRGIFAAAGHVADLFKNERIVIGAGGAMRDCDDPNDCQDSFQRVILWRQASRAANSVLVAAL